MSSPYPVKPKVLVLGPGGIKGYTELGALVALYEKGWLSEVKAFAGVSIGSIIALLLSCDYSPHEILKKALSLDLLNNLKSLDISKVAQNKGVMDHAWLRDILEGMLKDKYGKVPTLKELNMFTGYEFMCVTVNINKNSTEYLNYKTKPDLSCVDAVLMSSNIPFLFYKIVHNHCKYIDGAFGNPCPIDQYDDGKTPILNISILTHPGDYVDDDTWGAYAYAIAHIPIDQLELRIIEKASSMCQRIVIRNNIVSTTGMGITDEIKARMFLEGFERTKIYLASQSK